MLIKKCYIQSLFFVWLIFIPTTNLSGKSIFSPIIEVNNSVITQFELNQRAKLVKLLNFPGDPISVAEEQLIEERLKQNKAEEIGITVTNQEMSIRLSQFASKANLSVDDFYKRLKLLGIYPTTFQTYIETEILWQKIVKNKFKKVSLISDLDVKKAKNRAKFEDIFQVLLTEIILPTSFNDINDIEALAQNLKKIKSIEEFSDAARKYSAAPTATNGGLITWQNFENLPDIVKPLILGLSPGEVTEPIKLAKAIAIFQVRDIREIISNPEAVSLLNFITVSSNLSNSILLENIQNTYSRCEDIGRLIDGKRELILSQSNSPSSDLPPQVLKILEKLDPLESKLVIHDDNSELFILCERNKIQRIEAQSVGTTRQSIQELRLNNFSRGFLDAMKSNARIVIK